MEAYLYSQHIAESQLSLTDTLIDVSDLAGRGILNHNSSVWINAHSPRTDLWMLTNRSSYGYIHHARTPGFVRVSKSEIRWATDWDTTLSNPSLRLSLSDVQTADDDDTHITLIVKHRVPGKQVVIIANKGRKTAMIDGSYTEGNFTIIDLSSFVPKPIPEADSYEKSHAAHMGARHILRSLSRGDRRNLSPHIELLRFDLSDTDMDALQEVHQQMRQMSSSFVDTLRTRFADRGAVFDFSADEEG